MSLTQLQWVIRLPEFEIVLSLNEMAPGRKAQSALASMLLGVFSLAGGEDNDAATKWVGIYGWIQSGDQHAAAGQWPLAMGTYLESQKQIRKFAAEHPDFEPDLIAYRLAKLEQEIAAAGGRLTADEQEIPAKYRDVIEAIKLGQASRFSNEFEAALSQFERAKTLLDEIREKQPAGSGVALESRYQRLESDMDWLKTQAKFKKENPPVTDEISRIERGTASPASLQSGPPDGDIRTGPFKRATGYSEPLPPVAKRDPNQTRIFILGDSQSQTSFGPEFQKRLVDAGYEVFFHGVKNGTPFFWGGRWRSPVLTRLYDPASSPGEGGRFKNVSMRPRSVRDYVEAYDPDIFLFQAGTNFENVLAQENVTAISERILEYTRIAASRGARVLWIGPPDARDNVRSVKAQDRASATLRAALSEISEFQGYPCFFDSRPVCPISNDTRGDGEHPTHKGGIAWAGEAAGWVDDSISRLRCDENLRAAGESDISPASHFLTRPGDEETNGAADAIAMELELVAKSDPGDIRTLPYTDAFAVYQYRRCNTDENRPELAESGGTPDESSPLIYVLHWAVHNNGTGPRATRIASRKEGEVYPMQLLPLAGHPLRDALGTMTQFNDFDDLLAPVFLTTGFLEERAY